jgi:hypothetical protein
MCYSVYNSVYYSTCVDEPSIELLSPQLELLLQVLETVLHEVGVMLQVGRDVHVGFRDNLWRQVVTKHVRMCVDFGARASDT